MRKITEKQIKIESKTNLNKLEKRPGSSLRFLKVHMYSSE